MKVLDVRQGSPEWSEARLGIPTCSRFGEIVTPARLAYSSSAARYQAEILCEWALGFPVERGSSQAMERGTGMEDEARAWYEMQRDVGVVPTGFVLRGDGLVGGSPDGIVGEDGGVEIKCPMAHTHVLYLLSPARLVTDYGPQVQGYMYLTGREWWDVMSYHPTLPRVLERVDRDEPFQTALAEHLERFLTELAEGREKLLAMGVVPQPSFRRADDPAAWEEAAMASMIPA